VKLLRNEMRVGGERGSKEPSASKGNPPEKKRRETELFEGGACAPPRAELRQGRPRARRGTMRAGATSRMRQGFGAIFCSEERADAKGVTKPQCQATSGARIDTSAGGPEDED